MTDSTLVPSVQTDLTDYPPDSTATITASGFDSGATITFEADVYASDGSVIDEVVWTVTDNATTNPTGSGILTSSFAVLPTYANTTIHLTATEFVSAGADGIVGTADDVTKVATYVFTDSPVEHPSPPAPVSTATIIDLTAAASTGSVNGALFANELGGVTGTGSFGTFVQLQQYSDKSAEQGYNYDAAALSSQFEEGNAPPHNHALQLGAIPLVYADGHIADGSEGGPTYRAFRLDINQDHTHPLLSMDALQIYQASSGELTNFDPPSQQGGGGTGFGGAATLVYDLDGNGDVSVELNANLSHGSGAGDIAVLIPNSDFTNQDPASFVYLYSAFGQQAGEAANAGFEEWAVAAAGGGGGGGTPNAAIFIDKQVTGDHTAATNQDLANWFDVGNFVTSPVPVILVGKNVYFQTMIQNQSSGNSPSGSMDATVTDHQDTTNQNLDNFTFGGSSSLTVTLADLASATSNVKTETVLAGLNQDTATADGVETIPTSSTSNEVTGFDIATYYGATPGIALDKQVSGNGTSWLDIGNGNLADVPVVLVGSNVYFQAVATNTTDGGLGVTGAAVTDNTGLSFTPTGTPDVDLATQNGTETYTATLASALAGLQTDKATVNGTVSDSFGNSASVSADDSANYFGATPGITLDKQVSGNGTSWLDVGHGNLADVPVLLVGSHVYFQAVATNTTDGGLGVTGAAVTDNTGLSFTPTGTPDVDLATQNGTETYTATLASALAGLQTDKATVNGTVSDSFGNSASVSANDSANYYGATPAVNVEKLVSVDGGLNWYFTADDADDTIANISSLTGIDTAHLHIGTPFTLAGASVKFEVVVSNITDGGLGMTLVSVSDHEDTTNTNLGNFTLASTTLAAAGQNGDHEVSSVLTLTALSGTQTDTATASGTVTDSFGNSAQPTDHDSASYTGLALATPGLTAGFWAQHTYAWDAYSGDDNASLVSSHVLSSGDVLYALPTHGVVPWGASTVTNPSPVLFHAGVLLGDANASDSTDPGEVTLSLPWLSADLMVAGSTSTSSDARLILMQQAVAAQLNIDNHDADPGLLSAGGGNDLLGTAVKWLTGKLAFSDGNAVSAAYNVDNGPTNGVLDSGSAKSFEFNTSNSTFDKSGSLDFVSTSTSDWGVVKAGTKFDGNFVVDSSLSALLGGKYVEATGQDLKNALQAFNQDQLVTSTNGALIGWNVGGVISDVQTNDQDGMWKVLTDHGIGHLVTTLV